MVWGHGDISGRVLESWDDEVHAISMGSKQSENHHGERNTNSNRNGKVALVESYPCTGLKR